jgi:hypothetical protein
MGIENTDGRLYYWHWDNFSTEPRKKERHLRQKLKNKVGLLEMGMRAPFSGVHPGGTGGRIRKRKMLMGGDRQTLVPLVPSSNQLFEPESCARLCGLWPWVPAFVLEGRFTTCP